MTAPADPTGPPTVFVGSSSEAKRVAQYLADELEKSGVDCEVTVWSEGVFGVSQYSLEGLVAAAQRADFAVLVVTPDDTVHSRGSESLAPRDNIIFEAGLFMGALGRDRTYLVVQQGDKSRLKLPSDLHGLTWLTYQKRTDGNQRAAVKGAVLDITDRIEVLGSRELSTDDVSLQRRPIPGQADPHQAALAEEVGRLCASAQAQGWVVKRTSATILQLVSPRGRPHSTGWDPTDPLENRATLRRYVRSLREDGLRVDNGLRASAPGLDVPTPLNRAERRRRASLDGLV